MLILLFILIISEFLSLIVLRQHLFNFSRTAYYISVLIHFILSIWLWIIFIAVSRYPGFFDSPDNVSNQMALIGLICGLVIPRFFYIVLHYSGKLARIKTGGHVRWLTTAGLIAAGVIFIVTAAGTTVGRFNYKYENVSVGIKGLHKDLDGFRIVQISDLHLSGFYHHARSLENVLKKINELHPDLMINTGDFVTFGWRELGRNDTILLKASGKYGSFAIRGNHDAGTYHPYFTEADRKNNILLIRDFIRSCGYNLLENEHIILRVGSANLALIGVTTGGRYPNVTHGDIDTAMAGLDSSDFNLLLTHDPNHWLEKVKDERKDINLTLSGHTHGMQMGILTKKFRWSPSKYFYPHWNGLYSGGEQYHYVNRGLGVLAIPFRIWMPPEITVITLNRK
ncbi:MAG TPA: metallophosphoesterase [Bacteroidales bacterium]|jgi:predicted MPP superfamily phosphohydrolase|nr:metallophosphoesterase [Bacteroidales bacterium]